MQSREQVHSLESSPSLPHSRPSPSLDPKFIQEYYKGESKLILGKVNLTYISIHHITKRITNFTIYSINYLPEDSSDADVSKVSVRRNIVSAIELDRPAERNADVLGVGIENPERAQRWGKGARLAVIVSKVAV